MADEFPSTLIERAKRRWHAWRGRQTRAQEFGALGTYDTERILRDVNLQMSDMPTVLRGAEGRADLLNERLKALRLDPQYLEAAEHALYRDLQRTCLRCKSWRRCARDLARGDAQVGLDGYCANGHAIDQILVGVGAEHPTPMPTP